MDALLGDLTDIAKAEHLETAGVGQDRSFPLHKIVQIAVQLHDLLTRAQPQVEGVAENNLRAGGFHLFRRHPFDGAVGANGHKGRCFHHAALKHQATAAGATVGGIQFKFHACSCVRKTVRRFHTRHGMIPWLKNASWRPKRRRAGLVRDAQK